MTACIMAGGMNVVSITNYFLLKLQVPLHGWKRVWFCKADREPMTRELVGHRDRKSVV